MNGVFFYSDFKTDGVAFVKLQIVEPDFIRKQMMVEKNALVSYGYFVQNSELRARDGPIDGRVFAAPPAEIALRLKG